MIYVLAAAYLLCVWSYVTLIAHDADGWPKRLIVRMAFIGLSPLILVFVAHAVHWEKAMTWRTALRNIWGNFRNADL